MVIAALTFLFTIFPTPFAVFLLSVLAISVVLVVLKIVKYVLDAIPFL